MDRRQYLRDFLMLFTGTAASQLINLASYPLLARLYTPGDFGLFAMFVAASAIPAAVACGRFDLVVPTAPRHARFAILWLSYAIAGLVSLLAGVSAFAYWVAIEAPNAAVMALLMAVAVFLTGYVNATTMFLMRHERFGITSGSVAVRTLVTVVLQIGLAFVWHDPFALIAGFCAGLAAQGLQLGAHLRRHIPLAAPRTSQMKLMFVRYRKQVAVDIPSTLLAAAALNIMPFFLQFLYGSRAVGLYAMAQRIAITPLQLFNDALSQIFFQKAARAQEQRGSFWRELQFNLLTSGGIAVCILIAVLLLARPAMALFLGPGWEASADMLVILVPMLAVRSVVMSIATAVFVLKKASWLFYHNIANTMMMGAAFAIAYVQQADVYRYLQISAWLLATEFLVFGTILILATRANDPKAA